MGNVIVVGYDGSEVSGKAVGVATDLARDIGDCEVIVTCGMHQPASLIDMGRR
ncbi:MAG: hypothetical protein FJ000_03330, partial [Actinobacteria bacterium]|nr:hypothetical protein [Actinomycetota bacterium]